MRCFRLPIPASGHRVMRGLLSGLLATLAAAATGATTPAELLAAGRLQLDSTLEPAGPLVPGQKAKLRLHVATDRWFAGGTRIELPEVPGLIILQREVFAANSSENRGGQSWVVQRWTLDVYATAVGRFNTGPITLQVEVNTGEGVAAGPVQAPGITVVAAKPAGLTAQQWIASPRFSVREDIEPRVSSLRPGEAITRTITLEAEEVLDKMLPEVAAADSPGLAAYPRPPRLITRSNRGESTAQRIQEISYLAELPGDYQLPGYEFAWWNTGTGRLELISIESRPLVVSGSLPAEDNPGPGRLPGWLAPLAGGLLLLLLLVWTARRGLSRQRGSARPLALWRQVVAAWRRWRAPALPPRLNPWH